MLSFQANAFDLAGAIPAEAFFREDPTFLLENLNDSTGIGYMQNEWDDIRSYGFEGYLGWKNFAFGLCFDGFTFRGYPPEIPLRGDELTVAIAWMTDPVWLGPFRWSLGLGGGLRAWGDLGSKGVQLIWHEFLSLTRGMPDVFVASSLMPFFAFNSDFALDLNIDPALFPAAVGSIRAIVLPSGGIETAVELRAEWSSGLSKNWLGIRREDRLGAFAAADAADNAYEAGTWLLWGAKSGFFSVENSFNLQAPFALSSILLDFGRLVEGPARPGGLLWPDQELSAAGDLFEASLSLARALILGSMPEFHLGIETRMGGTWASQLGADQSHYQEGFVIAEVYGKKRGRIQALTPFLGAGLGVRDDAWANSSLERVTVLGRANCFVGKFYVGSRLDLGFFFPGSRGRICIDLGIGFSAASTSFPPQQKQLFLRIAILDE